MTLRAEHTRATREAIMNVARELFAERGFAATPTEEIVQRAGVTRGALYHHFGSKKGLFREVYEELEAAFVQAVAERVQEEPDAQRRLQVGLDMFLDACMEPAVQRIVMIDAPSVLEWDEWREIMDRYGLGLVKAALKQAMDEGLLAEAPLDSLSHLMSGALTEAGLTLARADDQQKARAEVGDLLWRLLSGLRR